MADARNSNLLPVKANGEVRLRSPPSWQRRQHARLQARSSRPESAVAAAAAIASSALFGSAPRKIDMIAGGASLSPRRWSWPMPATRRRRPWCRLTAWITAAQKNMKLTLSAGSSPGSSRCRRCRCPSPVVVLARAVDAGEGLSWSRQTRPYLWATFCMTYIVSCGGRADIEFSKMGAITYWLGATSLWRV